MDMFAQLKAAQIAMLDAQKYALQLEVQLYEAQKKIDCCKCGAPAAAEAERDEYAQPIG